MVGGFETPTSGRIEIAGQDVTRLPPNRRDVNMVFQDYALFPHLTVAGNVAFGLELKGLQRQAIDKRVAELLDMIHLRDMAERMPAQLSGGQRQRVALIRALAPDPSLLLLDEPLGALDAKLRVQMQIELKAMQERTGKTFLLVTHDQEEALTMSDTVVVMNQGRIEQVGAPLDLYHNPRNRFVAEFIGEINLLQCQIQGREGDELHLDWHGQKIVLESKDTARKSGDAIHVALRPEHITCSWQQTEHRNRIQGRILQRVFKGSRTLIDVETSHAQRLSVIADPLFLETGSGDELWLGFDSRRIALLAE
jgi:spermidine/putrescine transport system ATP-binding protein